LKTFEQAIFEEFGKFGTSRGLTPKAEWIKCHLLEVKVDYPYSMWSGFRRFSFECFKKGTNLRVGTYAAFRNYLRVLRRLGLILESKPWTSHSFEKHLICLNKGKLDDRAWQNPLAMLYPSTSWKKKSRKEKSKILQATRRRKGKKRGRQQLNTR